MCFFNEQLLLVFFSFTFMQKFLISWLSRSKMEMNELSLLGNFRYSLHSSLIRNTVICHVSCKHWIFSFQIKLIMDINILLIHNNWVVGDVQLRPDSVFVTDSITTSLWLVVLLHLPFWQFQHDPHSSFSHKVVLLSFNNLLYLLL